MAKKKVQQVTPEGDPETPEEMAQDRIAREARKAKRRNDPDAVVITPTEPQEDLNDSVDGSARTASAQDPTGSVEEVIQNSPVEAPESPVDELINEVGTSDNSAV